jgi:ribosome maturation factor RimP
VTVQEQVHRLLAPIVATLDVELWDVEYSGSTLRVVIDHSEGITIDRLAEVNRLISPILDQHDPVPGRYTLEVSSPGLERPLKRIVHFQRAIGEEILVKMVSSVVPRRFKGRLLAIEAAQKAPPSDRLATPSYDLETHPAAESTEHDAGAGPVVEDDLSLDGVLSLEATEIDGIELDQPEPRQLQLADVATARTVFVWGPTPKPGQPGAKKSNPKSSPKASKTNSPKNKKPAAPTNQESPPTREVCDEQ